MKVPIGAGGMDPHRNPPGFSLVQGGLLFQVLRWAHLSDDSPKENRRRVIVIASLAWLPLLVLSALGGRLLAGSVTVPFLMDMEAHVRFLVALPLLILAEVAVHRHVPPVLTQFLKQRLIPEQSIPRFEAAVKSAFKLSNSVLAEVLLIAVVYGVGILVIWRYVALDAPTWYATPSGEGSKLTLAGMWYSYISLPIVHFLLLRWYWRLLIWARFLWQVSRIDLSLIPAHADRAGGLGFLANIGYAFTMLAAAHGAIVAGRIASRIFLVGATLPQFADEIGVMVVFILCVVLGPLLVFAPQLGAAKQTGLREYGTLEESYVREFDAKWLRGGAPADEVFVGSADIQSMADLSNCYEVVRTMRVAPITYQAVVQLVAATLVPIVPLSLTMIPLSELLKKLLGIEL
jgi:hypothetical protein